MSIIKKIARNTTCILYNLQALIYTLLFRRDNRIIVIGAWMGERFADNSRFLYQYLYENKATLGLQKVIWVTRNEELNQQLNDKGYESYVIGTPESRHWHLKAGVHILCNMSTSTNDALTDIDTRYSCGAVKIQLWHGVGMKSVGYASNEYNKRKDFFLRLIRKKFIRPFCTLGGWNNEFFLSTSLKNAEINISISSCKKDHVFLSAYPRNCECLDIMPLEKDIIEKIECLKKKSLFLPTFRSDQSNKFIYPLSDEGFWGFLERNEITWIEKQHFFDSNILDQREDNKVIRLDPKFDVNLILKYSDFVISDYSSVVFDCIYKDIPIIMYCPDIDEFKKGDVGFLFDIEDYCGCIIARTIRECEDMILEIYHNQYFNESRKILFASVKQEFFQNRESDYASIWHDIQNVIS